MGIAALAISILAVLVAGVAAYFAKGQRDSASKAVEEARRAANAAEASAAEARRSANADEESARLAREAANQNRVNFQLVNTEGRLHNLRNDGTASAYGVTIDNEGNMCELEGDVQVDGAFPEFRSDHMEEFFILGTSTSFITVKWHFLEDLSDEPQTKRLAIGR